MHTLIDRAMHLPCTHAILYALCTQIIHLILSRVPFKLCAFANEHHPGSCVIQHMPNASWSLLSARPNTIKAHTLVSIHSREATSRHAHQSASKRHANGQHTPPVYKSSMVFSHPSLESSATCVCHGNVDASWCMRYWYCAEDITRSTDYTDQP